MNMSDMVRAAKLNPLYGNPEMQQAARDQANSGHDINDDAGKKIKPWGVGDIAKLPAGVFAESRANAVKVGAKAFALNVSEDEFEKMVSDNPDIKVSGTNKPASTGTSVASKSAATGKPTKVVTVDDNSWGARADHVVWEGVKQVTGTPGNPKKQIMLSEMEESRKNALSVGAKCTPTPQQYIDWGTAGIMATNAGIMGAAAYGAAKLGQKIGDMIVPPAKPKSSQKTGGA